MRKQPISPRIEIHYCKQCRWLLHGAWFAQELLTTFDDEIGEIALIPGSGGIFEIHVNKDLICSRKEKVRFPEIKWHREKTWSIRKKSKSGTLKSIDFQC